MCVKRNMYQHLRSEETDDIPSLLVTSNHCGHLHNLQQTHFCCDDCGVYFCERCGTCSGMSHVCQMCLDGLTTEETIRQRCPNSRECLKCKRVCRPVLITEEEREDCCDCLWFSSGTIVVKTYFWCRKCDLHFVHF